MIYVAIADDHAVIRRGIQLFITQEPEMTLVLEAADGEELMDKMLTKRVDVLILDIDMPKMNGITAIEHILDKFRSVKILVLSMHPEEIYGLTARKLGAMGYISKDEDPGEVIRAVKKIARGQEHFSEELYRKNKSGKLSSIKLSKRESEVLKLLGNGMSNKDISNILFISEKTVSTYKIRLMSKLGAKSVVDLVQFGNTVKIEVEG